jgi:hypothetical protein
MKKGLCFVCHQQGHRSSDHKNGNIPTPPFSPNRNENRYQPQKKSGTDTYAKIRALMAELDKEEKGKTLLLMEESGFSRSGLPRCQKPLNFLSALYY